jgi:hypothetical protein
MQSMYNTKLDFLSNQVAIDFNMFCPLMLDRIGCYVKGSLAVTKQKS